MTQQYMALLARTEGLFTDPCYTGKIFHGFVDLVTRGKIPEGENAIFLALGRYTGNLEQGASGCGSGDLL